MDIAKSIFLFFTDLTNAGMVIETLGIILVAIYGIPRNNDVSENDTVIIKKSGDELKKAIDLLKLFTRRERLGFFLMALGIVLMLIDRNI